MIEFQEKEDVFAISSVLRNLPSSSVPNLKFAKLASKTSKNINNSNKDCNISTITNIDNNCNYDNDELVLLLL